MFNAALEILSLSCKPPDPALPGVVEIAFELFDLDSAIKREDVGAAAVKNEAVARDDDRIASEFLYSALKGTKCLDIKIIGGTVSPSAPGSVCRAKACLPASAVRHR